MIKKSGSIALLAVVGLAIALFMILPTNAHASNPVDITGATSVADIKAEIQDEIDAIADTGGSVVVEGTFTGADAILELVIPADVRVTWNAEYEGEVLTLIYLNGQGSFEVVEGKITNTMDRDSGSDYIPSVIFSQSPSLIISGGEVLATGSG
ncbi:MAG: hypothetical protein LBU61_00560, partial [Coriobacteriales bacterium]|nr:hypothetical protein [Coriobacteriales bacterium]